MKTFLYWLVRTEMSFAQLAARLTLGIAMLPAGFGKLGENYAPTMNTFTQGLGIPAPFAFLVIMAESFGALGLILGVFGRFCAFGNALVMIGAILMVHGQHGFRLIDPVERDPNKMGYVFNFVLLGLAVVVMLAGSGAFSFDRWLTKKMQAKDVPTA